MIRSRRCISLGFIIVLLFCGASAAILLGWIFRAASYDYMQHDSDAAYFFEKASSGHLDFKLDSSVLTQENTLPIVLWSSIYRLISDRKSVV